MDMQQIKLVGLGGAGCRVVDCAAGLAPDGPGMVAVDTDADSLDGTGAPDKLQIGLRLTGGLGAGGDPKTGRQAARADIEMLRGLFRDVSLVAVVLGLGGGTATGAAPVLMKAAREAGALTLCFAMLPFSFEGRERKNQANRAIAEMHAAADVLIVVPNDRLHEFVDEGRVSESFDKVNRVLARSLNALIELLTKPGYIRIDFSDLRTMVRNSTGTCTLGFGAGSGPDRAMQAVETFVLNPMLEKGRVLDTAQGLLLGIAGGTDLTVSEVGTIMETISGRVPRDCRVFMGTAIRGEGADGLTITGIVAEQWTTHPAGAYGAVSPEEDSAAAEDRRPGASGPRRPEQTSLRFESFGRGRFQDVEPTLQNGEDLDVPTYLRRGIPIDA